MRTFLTSIKTVIVALLVAVAIVPVVAQDYDEIELTPQLQAALEKYVDVQSFSEGMACVCMNGKYGFINTDGKEVVPCKYDEAEPFCEGLALVKSKGKYGFINTRGELVEPFKYDNPTEVFFHSCWILGLNGKYGVVNIVNSNLEVIVPFKYDFMDSFSLIDYDHGAGAIVKLNGKSGVIDTNDDIIIPIKYDFVNYDRDGMWSVSLNGKYGFVNNDGVEVVPCKYNIAMMLDNGVVKVFLGEKCGYIDTTGVFKFSHNITFEDADWLIGEWDGITIQYSSRPNQVTIIDRKGTMLNVELRYDEKEDKYILFTSQNGQRKTVYYVDMVNCRLIDKNGTIIYHEKEYINIMKR